MSELSNLQARILRGASWFDYYTARAVNLFGANKITAVADDFVSATLLGWNVAVLTTGPNGIANSPAGQQLGTGTLINTTGKDWLIAARMRVTDAGAAQYFGAGVYNGGADYMFVGLHQGYSTTKYVSWFKGAAETALISTVTIVAADFVDLILRYSVADAKVYFSVNGEAEIDSASTNLTANTNLQPALLGSAANLGAIDKVLYCVAL